MGRRLVLRHVGSTQPGLIITTATVLSWSSNHKGHFARQVAMNSGPRRVLTTQSWTASGADTSILRSKTVGIRTGSASAKMCGI
jgi:hypothetical protein